MILKTNTRSFAWCQNNTEIQKWHKWHHFKQRFVFYCINTPVQKRILILDLLPCFNNWCKSLKKNNYLIKTDILMQVIIPSISLTVHCSRLHHTCSFSMWSCGSHFSVFSCEWSVSCYWCQSNFLLLIEAVDMVSSRMGNRKAGDFSVLFVTNVLHTCSTESQNGPCFVC